MVLGLSFSGIWHWNSVKSLERRLSHLGAVEYLVRHLHPGVSTILISITGIIVPTLVLRKSVRAD